MNILFSGEHQDVPLPLVLVYSEVSVDDCYGDIGFDDLYSGSRLSDEQLVEKERMDRLITSVGEKGVINPLMANSWDDGLFHVLVGNSRLFAAEANGIATVNVFVSCTSFDDSIPDGIRITNTAQVEQYFRDFDIDTMQIHNGVFLMGTDIGDSKWW